jgi:hypothetical protein
MKYIRSVSYEVSYIQKLTKGKENRYGGGGR